MGLFQFVLQPLKFYSSSLSTFISLVINKYYSQTVRKQLAKKWNITPLPAYDGNIQMQISLIIVFVTIHIEWLLLMVAIVAMIIIKKVMMSYLSSVVQNYSFLVDYSWQQMKQNVRDGLECIKFSKMINKGYQLRSNTNIILDQEEEIANLQNSQNVNFDCINQKDIQMQRYIINIYEDLLQLCHTAWMISQSQQNKVFQLKKYQIPLSFRNIFEMNKKCLVFFDILKRIPLSFKIKQLDPSQSPFVLYKMNKTIQRIIQRILHVENKTKAISSLISKFTYIQSKQQKYGQLLHYFTIKNGEDHKGILQIYSQLQLSVKQQNKNNKIEDISLNCASQILQNKLSQVNLKPKDNADIPSFKQKRQFMKKLDLLLSIGMIRRQQQLINTNYDNSSQISENQEVKLTQTIS